MTQQKSVQMDSELAKYVAELEKRVRPGVHSTR